MSASSCSSALEQKVSLLESSDIVLDPFGLEEADILSVQHKVNHATLAEVPNEIKSTGNKEMERLAFEGPKHGIGFSTSQLLHQFWNPRKLLNLIFSGSLIEWV